jgi:hypothetical protein
VRLVATLGAGQGKSSELVFSALIRTRFCELLSPRLGAGESDLFLMGLLSLMDVIMQIPMARILESVPVGHESKEALLGSGRLHPLHLLMLSQESGAWEQSAVLCSHTFDCKIPKWPRRISMPSFGPAVSVLLNSRILAGWYRLKRRRRPVTSVQNFPTWDLHQTCFHE